MLIVRAGSSRLILKARLMGMVCSAVVVQEIVKHVLKLVKGDCPLQFLISLHFIQFPDLVRVILKGQLLKPAGRGVLRGLDAVQKSQLSCLRGSAAQNFRHRACCVGPVPRRSGLAYTLRQVGLMCTASLQMCTTKTAECRVRLDFEAWRPPDFGAWESPRHRSSRLLCCNLADSREGSCCVMKPAALHAPGG